MNTNNTCLFNTLYFQYIEDIGRNEYFYYDLKYPIIYNVKNGYFQVQDTILKNLNERIKSDVYTFKDGILEEEQQLNELNTNSNSNNKKINYKVFSNYDLTFNKNQVISLIMQLMALDDNNTQYNDLYNYNIDLLNGNQLLLKNIFRPNVDYIKLVSDAINLQIKQNPQLYYPDTTVTISEDEAFYLTDKGIIIYFALDQIAPATNGFPKFLIPFSDFASYINPRFYCIINETSNNRFSRRSKPNRIYY